MSKTEWRKHGIGLLGGTFNPIHNGHLYIAAQTRLQLGLSQVLFIPSGDPPHRQDMQLSAQIRYEMVQLALHNHPDFVPCDIEVKRPGRSYTIDTVQALKQRFKGGPLVFIIGTDAFRDFDQWRYAEQLLTLCHFAIVPRSGHPFSSCPGFGPLAGIDRRRLQQLDDGETAPYCYAVDSNMQLHFLPMSMRPISASQIRQDIIAQAPEIASLPQSVLSTILTRRLYRERD